MAGKSGALTKLLLLVIVLAVAAVAAFSLARTTAVVAVAKRGIATNEVFGVVKVIAPGGIKEIPAEYGGTVLSSSLAVNRQVGAGEVLLQLDTADIDLLLKQKNADLKNAKDLKAIPSQASFARDAAEQNVKTLEAQKLAAQNVTLDDVNKLKRLLEAATAALDQENLSADARIKALEVEIEKLNRQKAKMTITAPFDGTLTEVFVEKGEAIQPRAVARMISNQRWVQAKIDGKSYSLVQPGQEAVVTLSAYPGREFKAKVLEVGKSPDVETGRYLVRLEIGGIPADQLLALLVNGLEGDATINVGQKENVIIVPRLAVTGTRVFVVKDGRVEERRVQVGYNGAYSTEILKGVEEGEQVIVDLSTAFRDGDRVKTRIAQ